MNSRNPVEWKTRVSAEIGAIHLGETGRSPRLEVCSFINLDNGCENSQFA